MLTDYTMVRVRDYLDEMTPEEDGGFSEACAADKDAFVVEAAGELASHMRKAADAFFTHGWEPFDAWKERRGS